MKLTIKKYRSGSYITVESEMEGNHFFIIRRGKVKVFSSIGADDEKNSKFYGPGDFFAVISCMTGQPRLVSSYAVEDSEILLVKKNQFGFLIEKSAPLAIRIIRSFSNHLRRYDEMLVSRTLNLSENEDPVYTMKKTGEYYLENKDFVKAAHVFIQFLKNNPDSHLAPEVVEHLQGIDRNILENIRFPNEISRIFFDGQMIFSDNEIGIEMYIIEYGKVKITKILKNKEALIAVLNPGDIFGEMALLNSMKRTASAIAFGDVKCTAFNSANFNIILRRNSQLGMRIITLLSERIWTIYKQLDNLFFSDYKARIYDILLTHLLKKKVNFNEDTRFNFPYGVEEIKKMLGAVDEEVLDREVKRMLKEGIVLEEEGKLICTGVQTLAKEVEYARKMEMRKRKIESSKK